ncbi:ribosomal RNA-processing protein 7 homolog A [Rhincodon typus]|uniref:ribosomal RNA-processing protein 7 homolog A n=1 Tax=Rhincodon typus TaxID=259920 RepID=UPI0020300CEA|nr:ribosomal RNA-processing protein 7 homolog A [Rhincodon typus]
MAAPSEGAKFTVIPLRISPRSSVCRQLFVKQHRVRDPDPQRPQDRTLFVLNLPPYINQECVHRLFSQCGPVTSVELQEKPGPSTKSKDQKSKFFSRPLAQGFQVAYVVFKSSAAVKHAVSLKAQKPWVLTTAQHPLRTGLQKWAEDYYSSITDPRDLQDHIDQFMEQHDREQAEVPGVQREGGLVLGLGGWGEDKECS